MIRGIYAILVVFSAMGAGLMMMSSGEWVNIAIFRFCVLLMQILVEIVWDESSYVLVMMGFVPCGTVAVGLSVSWVSKMREYRFGASLTNYILFLAQLFYLLIGTYAFFWIRVGAYVLVILVTVLDYTIVSKEMKDKQL